VRKRSCILSLIVIFIFTGMTIFQSSFASSLWDDSSAYLYSDHKAREEGDIVTILVQEETKASGESVTESGKSGDTGLSLSFLIDLLSLVIDGGVIDAGTIGGRDLINFRDLGFDGGDDFQASGSTSQTGSYQASISAVVQEVLPSGNLFIEGEKNILVNEEKQRITISGIVHPDDITAENFVLSTRVADAEISFTGEGVVSDKQKPGILTRLFNWLF